MLVGLGQVDLVCRDLGRSLAFYAAVFGPLGLAAPHLVGGERGEQIHYLRFPKPGSGSLGGRDDPPSAAAVPAVPPRVLRVLLRRPGWIAANNDKRVPRTPLPAASLSTGLSR